MSGVSERSFQRTIAVAIAVCLARVPYGAGQEPPAAEGAGAAAGEAPAPPKGAAAAPTEGGADAATAAARKARGLEEIIVTARRREESMQDVPVAVTGLGAEELQNTGVR